MCIRDSYKQQINLSAHTEKLLAELLETLENRAWLERNTDAIIAHGKMIAATGLAGEHPGVKVEDDGDLVVQTDFRSVYQSIISEWLGGDPAAILPGGPFPSLHRYDGGSALMK